MIASLLNISEPYFFYSSIENTTREMYKPEIVIIELVLDLNLMTTMERDNTSNYIFIYLYEIIRITSKNSKYNKADL